MKRIHFPWLMAVTAVAVLAAQALGDERQRPDRDQNGEVLRGRIVRVDPATHEITIRTRHGEERTLRVDKQSTLEVDRQPVALDQLKDGTRVRVVYENKNGSNHVIALRSPILGPGVLNRVEDALRSVRDFGFDRRQAYEKRLADSLHEVDDQIDQLQEKADTATGAAKQQYIQEIQQLEQRRREARQQLDKVQNATAASWEDVKNGVNRALTDLRQSLQQAQDHLK